MKIWLDDIRLPPAGWVWAKDAHEAIPLLAEFGDKITEISLDHDLGDDLENGTGYTVACWIEQGAHSGRQPRLKWHIHSANPVGRANIMAAMLSAEREWDAMDEYRKSLVTDDI